jgi:Protein of unknown function (DUF2982)
MQKWCPTCKKVVEDPGELEISKYAKFWRDNRCYSCNTILRATGRAQVPPTDEQRHNECVPLERGIDWLQPPIETDKSAFNKFEVKPKANSNAVLLSILCLLFIIGSIFAISTGEMEAISAGLFALALFGLCQLRVPKLWHRKVSMALSPRGLEQVTFYGTAIIPWQDIERIGTIRIYGNRVVGLQLRSYDRYLRSMSSDMAEALMKDVAYLKLFARAASLLDMPSSVTLWSKLEGRGEPGEALESLSKVGSLAETLLWSRKACGYDLALGWADVDRSAGKFADLLSAYQQKYTLHSMALWA